MKGDSGTPISRDEASKICSEIRKEKAVRLFSQSRGCLRFSKGESAKMCYTNKLGNRGCNLVNKWYDGLFKT